MSCAEFCGGEGTRIIFQSNLFTRMSDASSDLVNGDGGLSEKAIHAGQASIFAGQGGLDMFIGGQLCQVSQSCYCRLTAQHLGCHSLNVTGRHATWELFVEKSKK